MKKRILSILLVLVMVLGMPAQVFATEVPTEPCTTEGCTYGANHEGNCSNYVAPTEPCTTEGCTFGANHEGNCSNYVAPTEPCATEGCTFGANHEGNCSNYVAPTEPCATEGCTYGANHEGNCSNYVEPTADELAAQTVIDLINAIGTVTRDSEAAINAADNAYQALTDAQKLLVTNVQVLEAAKLAYGALDEPETVADLKTVIYNQNSSGWPAADAYIKKITVKADNSVISEMTYSWSGSTCTVTLTPANGADESALKAKVTLMFAKNGSPSIVVNGESVTTSTNANLSAGYTEFDVTASSGGVSDTRKIVVKLEGIGGANTEPALRTGVAASVTATAYTGVPFTLNLADIFEDADGDTLTYKVKIGNNTVDAEENFSYTFTEATTKEQKLVFTANDGKADSPTHTVRVTSVSESSLSLDKDEALVDLGSTLTLTPTVTPETAAVTWTSADESVATVENGVVRPLKAGEAVITASAAGKTASCTVTVNDPNELKAKVTITINNQGTLALIRKSLTVLDQDNDGALTFHDALVILHEEYGKEYVAEESSYGLFVTTMWDVQTGGSNYFLINNVPLAYSVGTDTVENGDNLYATNMVDLYGFSDVYTHFGTASKTVTAGEAFDLTLYALAMNWETYNRESVPAGGISVGTYSGSSGGSYTSLGKVTDANGKVTLSFEKAGTYIVSATGNYADEYGMESPIMPPLCIVTVKEAQPESVSLSAETLTMTINSTQTLTATVEPSNAANKSVSWTSSDESVATVNSSGIITAKKVGQTTITATTINGKKASCVVTVELADPAEDAVVYVTISKRGVLALVNEPVTVKDLNSDGMLTYAEAMEAAHAAHCPDGFALAESGWTIKLWGEETSNLLFFKNDIPLSRFIGDADSTVKAGDTLYAAVLMYEEAYKDHYTRFTPKNLTVQQGETVELTLTGYEGAASGSNPSWKAISGAQIGIWSNGSFTAISEKTTDENGKTSLAIASPGTYVISAYGDSRTAPLMAPYCVVTVEAAAVQESVTLDETELVLTVGDEKTLTATVTPEDAEVEWSSDDATVAAVENGKVTALKAGTATITAKVGSATATCTVTVKEAAVEYLSALKFTAGTSKTAAEYEIQPAFDPGVKEYTLIVPDSKTTVAVWATLAENQTGAIKAVYKNTSNTSKTVTVTSGKSTGASLSAVLKSDFNGNTVTITVGGNEAYVITIVRKATLSGLTLSYGTESTAAVLNPEFNTDKTEYSARVPGDTAITVKPTAKVSKSAVVTINGAVDTVIPPVWNGLNSEIEIVVSGGEANPDVVPTTYKVSLAQCAIGIEIATPPTKTEYEAGDKFDPAGMTLKATYSDGSTETIDKDRYTYTPEDALAPNVTEIEVTFDGLTVKQSITIPSLFEGTGTQEDPYLIQTAEDLVKLSELVENGLTFEGQYLKMTADITLPADWEPLGPSKTNPFSGNFDGGNHLLTVPEGGLPLIGTPIYATLSNLNIYGSKIAGYGVVNNYTQISAVTKSIIVIDNVTLKSGTQTLKSGFIGGYASGQDVVTIKNSTVERGVVIGYDKSQSSIGSFGGDYNGTIQNCVSYATVYGVDFVGGIVGGKGQTMGDFIITGCQFYGTVSGSRYVGGIAGHGYTGSGWGVASAPNTPGVTIKNCTCSGTVTGSSYVGGILGAESGLVQAWENGIGYIQNNSFTGAVSGGSYVGGIVGYMRSLNKYTVITGNYYAASCGASAGIGGAEYVDTNCETHETASGTTYLNTENGTSGCPSVQYCSWKKAHNRTDDPLGADAAKLCYTDTQMAPVAVELKTSGTYKTEYIEGEELDLTGIELTVIYNDDSTETVELEDVTVSGYDKTKVGEQTVTLSYNGLTAELKVTVVNDGKITVTVAVLGDSKHNSDTDGIVHNLASGNLTTWVSATEVELEGSVTAWDAIKQVLDEKGLSCSYSYNAKYGSVYIESVKGLGEFTNGVYSGWLYSVNGKQPNIGVSAYYLEDGDKIVLHYTDDYTKGGGSSINGDEAAAAEVEKLIDAIGTVTLNKEEKIEEARKAYDALTYAQKQKVTNYSKLTEAEAKLKELKKEAVEKVEELIDTVVIGSDTFEEDVLAAQKAYNNLAADQRKLVGNYNKLVACLKELAELEDLEAAEAVEKLIDAIGTVTIDSEEKIKAAREAYEELADGQKPLVKNLAVLEAAEDALQVEKQLQPVADIHEITGDYMENLGTPAPGSVGGEWMVVGLIRADRELKNADEYYDAAVKFVQENADENNRLHHAKSTENARMILALTAMGKDVTDVDGRNLLEGLNEMSYIQKQGINGPIWALIAFDSGNYPTPEGDVSRDSLIDVILDAQLADGGWALSGDLSDPDMTGMALQALAPYYETNEDVAAAVDAAVETLSLMQASDGSFSGIDGKSSESIAQVIVALSALGIDAHTDARFVKNGVSALDALYAFYVEGGGFRHIPDGDVDGMATEQAYYALTAYFRMREGKTALYDMTDVIDLGGGKAVEVPAGTEPAPAEPVEEPAQEEPEPTLWQKVKAWFKKLF